MSVETNPVGDQPNGASGKGGDNSGDLVKYETYQKVLNEKKTIQQQLGELKAKDQEREQALLVEQGKFKEAAERAIKEKNDAIAAAEAKDKAYAKNVFNKEVKEVARQLGARPEALEDIVKVGDWADVSIDDNFNVNHEQLKTQILALSKAKPFYFSGTAPRPNDVNTSSNGAPPSGKKISEMSIAELEAQVRAQHNK
jgi:hypothetical protein